MREAIVARSDGNTYFFRDSGGDLIIVSKDGSNTELTENEIKALSADEMREAILNTQDYDVYRHISGELSVICTADLRWGVEYGANGVIEWGHLVKRTRRNAAK